MASIGQTNIASLVGLGADAMTNMYEVRITPPAEIITALSTVTFQDMVFRVSSFNPPVGTQQSYDVHWKTVSLKKPKPKIDLQRTFDIEFRVDAYYQVYEQLKKWENLYHITGTGFATGRIDPSHTGTVVVKALKAPVTTVDQTDEFGTVDPVISWQYEDVWIEKITDPNFTTDSSEPVKSTVTFNFGKFLDPASSFEGYTL